MNFMKEKGINKIEDFHKVIHQSIKKPEMVEEPEKEKIVEIINTDIPIKNKDSVNNGDKDENEGNIINLNEEEEEKIKTKTNKIKVYIHDNRDESLINKYYDGEAIGYIEFESEQKIEQDFIYENNIRITIEDLEDFL